MVHGKQGLMADGPDEAFADQIVTRDGKQVTMAPPNPYPRYIDSKAWDNAPPVVRRQIVEEVTIHRAPNFGEIIVGLSKIPLNELVWLPVALPLWLGHGAVIAARDFRDRTFPKKVNPK